MSLPKPQRQWLEEKVRSGRYLCKSEVVRDALRIMEILESNHEALEDLILQGLESGPGVPVTPEYWRKRKAELHREHECRQGKAA